MAVTTDKNKVEENGNGIKTNFEFSFVLRENSHLKVYKYDITTKEAVLQTETVDYIIPVPALGQVGGSVEYTIAPTTDERSILLRELPYTQETSLPYEGNLPSKTLEYTYDNNTMLIQQLHEVSNRTFKSGIGSNPGDIDFTLPTFTPKKAFIVDDTGTKVILSEDDYADQLANVTAQADSAEQSAQNAAAEVSRAQAFADDASTSATNAGTAETNAGISASNASTSETNASNSASNASASAVLAVDAKDDAVTAKNEAETAQSGAEQAEQNVIDLLDQFPDLVPTDTGRLGVVNDFGTGYDLLGSGTTGQVLTSNGADAKPEYKNAPATVNVTDNLLSTSPTDALSANQGRVLKGLVDGNTVSISNNAANISSNFSSITTLNDDIFAVDTKADNNTGRITTAETNIFNNTQAIANNTSDITANKQILDKIPVTNPTDTGRLAIVNSTGDAFELLGTGATGQVLTSAGGNAIPSFQNASGGTVIIDDLLSTSAVDALSANQGRVLKGFTDANASAITANTNLIDRIPSTVAQDTGKLLAVDPTGVEFNLLDTGTSGQVLTSGGTNTIPTFQDPPSGVGLSVNKIEVTGDYTLTMDAFDGDFDIVLIEAFTNVNITIDTNSSNYFDLLGKNIIIQAMDNLGKDIFFTPDAAITGYQSGDYNVNGYTRSVITLLSVADQSLKILYVDDQSSLQQLRANSTKLSYYPSNPIANKGRIVAVNDTGSVYSTISNQGNAGDVLTSRGLDLQPEFKAPEVPSGVEKIKRIDVGGRNYTFLFSEFDDGSSAIILECTGRFILTISLNGYTGDYNTIVGRLLIIQQMDDDFTDVRFIGFDNIGGSRTEDFDLRPSTRATMTLVTDTGATEKNIFIDDQEWAQYWKNDHEKLLKYITPTTSRSGQVLAINDDGTQCRGIIGQGNTGDVLTSQGAGVIPAFLPLSLPNEVEKVKVLKTYADTTYNLSEFGTDVDALYIQSFNNAEITIDANYVNYQDIVGKLVIIQSMDEKSVTIRLNNFNVIEGYYTTNAFFIQPYTRATLTILSKTDGTSRAVFIDDQSSVTQTKTNDTKLRKYVNPSAGLAGMLMAITENGANASIIADQGDAGEVLTSRGAGLLPSFQPAGGGGGGVMELLSTVDLSVTQVSNIDFIFPTDRDDVDFIITFSNVRTSGISDSLLVRYSENGGSTFETTGYSWCYLVCTSTASSANLSQTGSEDESRMLLNRDAMFINGDIHIKGPLKNTLTSMFTNMLTQDAQRDTTYRHAGGGTYENVSIVNAVRIFPNEDPPFTDGLISLYRITR